MDESTTQDLSSATATRAADSPRLFWMGMAVFLVVIVFLGFGSTYGRQLVMGQEIGADGPYDGGLVATDWVIHLHAAVFVGWMVLLLAQAILVARGRTRTHMTLGGYGGLAFGALVLVTGGLITYMQTRTAVSEELFTWAEAPAVLIWEPFLGEPVIGLVNFATLWGLGLYYRTRPEAHKRYMVFGTIALVNAATSRMGYLLGPWSNEIGLVAMVAPVFAYDLVTDGRFHRATLIGTLITGLSLALSYLNIMGMGLMIAGLFAYDLYAERRVHPATVLGAGIALLLFAARALFG